MLHFQRGSRDFSLQKIYEVYNKEYLSLDAKDQTKVKREQVTKDLSYSVVAKALVNILVYYISVASMHAI